MWTFHEIHETLPRGGRGLWTFQQIHGTLPRGGRGSWTFLCPLRITPKPPWMGLKLAIFARCARDSIFHATLIKVVLGSTHGGHSVLAASRVALARCAPTDSHLLPATCPPQASRCARGERRLTLVRLRWQVERGCDACQGLRHLCADWLRPVLSRTST